MKFNERLLRAVLAGLIAVFMDQYQLAEGWLIVATMVATYLAFTAYTGECLAREYLTTRRKETKRSKHSYR